jgi:DNA adenine methylase
MSAVTRPVLRYHGGKFKLADWIISTFPPHRVYVEPFGGAASVLMLKDRSYAEVYNDRWDVVVTVFRVLRDPEKAKELRRLLELTPYARSEFYLAGHQQMSAASDIECARLAILRSFAGFGSASTNGEYATGFRANSNRSGTTPAHDWVNYPSNVEKFAERLRGVIIENKDASEVMLQHDGKDTLHYVDPPYPHDTRVMARGNASYVCEMTDADHHALSETLRGLKGMVVLSGYPCDLYDSELYSGFTQCHFFAGIGVWSYAFRLARWPDDRPAWTASTPCPSFSAAGKGLGFNDPRHLWPELFRLTRVCRPRVLFGEQVAAAIGHGWLDLVCGDLEAEGYAVAPAVLGAHSAGAPHIRRPIEPGLQPLAHRATNRVVKLRGFGDGIVPQVAAAFIQAYCEVRGQ